MAPMSRFLTSTSRSFSLSGSCRTGRAKLRCRSQFGLAMFVCFLEAHASRPLCSLSSSSGFQPSTRLPGRLPTFTWAGTKPPFSNRFMTLMLSCVEGTWGHSLDSFLLPFLSTPSVFCSVCIRAIVVSGVMNEPPNLACLISAIMMPFVVLCGPAFLAPPGWRFIWTCCCLGALVYFPHSALATAKNLCLWNRKTSLACPSRRLDSSPLSLPSPLMPSRVSLHTTTVVLARTVNNALRPVSASWWPKMSPAERTATHTPTQDFSRSRTLRGLGVRYASSKGSRGLRTRRTTSSSPLSMT
mmetsp:Transcript_37101/g.89653  ORF Transcript_37101/g.89653 Transcript_37101/m.89653 type:complete len:299 (-) Transcript_37101:505-1401(-)